MDPTAAIIAVAGLITTASSPMLLSWRNARNQREASLRDLRTVLYTEATIYAQSLESFLNRITTPYTTARGERPELTHSDVLTARMRLIAPPEINAAWQQLIVDEERLRWNLEEDHPGFGHDPGDALDDDDADVVILRGSIEKFYSATRKESVGK